ncbi:hypothetical protein HPG69_018708 [Diceros bicornis minor]|uniref:Uncharacterized protein n=1 Tax=Diceros bicornis minor TaxID=77932 RepID=A0A7J7EDZ0_DICBM|nr:hypothetical protein HPG69_018708 [Diceros bicornis minor]
MPSTHKPSLGGGPCPAPPPRPVLCWAAASCVPWRRPVELQTRPPCGGLLLDPSAALGGSALRVRRGGQAPGPTSCTQLPLFLSVPREEREFGGFLRGASKPRGERQGQQSATKFPSALAGAAAPYLLSRAFSQGLLHIALGIQGRALPGPLPC